MSSFTLSTVSVLAELMLLVAMLSPNSVLAPDDHVPPPELTVDVTKVKVIAFDLFGTVFDLSQAPRQEVRAYVRHVRSECVWSPLSLPESWATMPVFPDSAEGIRRLRESYTVVTLSNAPIKLQTRMNRNAAISWDFMIPLESIRAYKPAPQTYQSVCDLLGCKPSEVLMVTGNKTAGDIEAARALGMQAVLIRDSDGLATITALADQLTRFTVLTQDRSRVNNQE